MNPAETMVAALAEAGYKVDPIGAERVLMEPKLVPPGAALRAWQIAHNDHEMTMAGYVAYLKAAYPQLASGYDQWLRLHGVTLDEALS